MPELPDARRLRFMAAHAPPYDAAQLTQSRAMADFFEAAVAAGAAPKAASNWIMGELARALNEAGRTIEASAVSPARLAGLLTLVEQGTISGAMAKTVFDTMFASGRDAAEIVASEGLAQIDDDGQIAALVAEAIARHADAAAQFRAGRTATFGFLVGQVMKAAGGKANPRRVNDLLRRALESVIEIQRLSKVYRRGVYALRDLSLTVDKGEFLFMAGPSGAGKSTLLRLLLREELPTEGTLTVAGRNLGALTPSQVQSYRRTVGFIFQDFRLVPRFTVFQNVAFVMRVLGVPLPTQQRKTFQALKWVGLQHRMNALPEELSGGEQQRIAIARALVNDPQLVLADEPTGNLDPDLALEIMNLFRGINARGTTVIVATHDRELIRRVGRRTITLEQGRLAEVS